MPQPRDFKAIRAPSLETTAERARSKLQAAAAGASGLRWTPAMKAAVVADVEAGRLTREAACKAYGLTIEELENWTVRAAQAAA